MTAQIGMRLTLCSFKHKNRKVSNYSLATLRWTVTVMTVWITITQVTQACYMQHCMDLQLAVDPYKRCVLFEMDWLSKTHKVSWHISANQILTKHSPMAVVWNEEWGLQFSQKSDIWRRIDHLFVYFWTSEIGHFDSSSSSSSSSSVVQTSALKVKALEVKIDACRKCLNSQNSFFERFNRWCLDEIYRKLVPVSSRLWEAGWFMVVSFWVWYAESLWVLSTYWTGVILWRQIYLVMSTATRLFHFVQHS